MGHTTAEASIRRQLTLIDCDKHYSALQGASATAGVTVHGEVRPAFFGLVIECTPWQRCPHCASQRRMNCAG